MPWENVGRFLDRFNNLKPPKKFIQSETAQVVKSVASIDINPDEIEERGGIIYIKTKNSSLKNEIFLKKNLILDILQKRIGNKAPKDLRF
jgi:hypothetical protein